MKEINPEEAASWSEEEYTYNVMYLTARCRWAELDKLEAARGAAKAAVPKRAKKVVEDDEED